MKPSQSPVANADPAASLRRHDGGAEIERGVPALGFDHKPGSRVARLVVQHDLIWLARLHLPDGKAGHLSERQSACILVACGIAKQTEKPALDLEKRRRVKGFDIIRKINMSGNCYGEAVRIDALSLIGGQQCSGR